MRPRHDSLTTEVVVYVGEGHDLYHTSRLLTGLCALDARGAVSLRYRTAPADSRWLVGDAVVVCLDLNAGSRLRVAIDLRDGLGVSRPILDYADVYLKRAFYRPELAELPPDLAAKLRPFGLNYGCRSGASTVRLLRAIGWRIAAQGQRGLARLRQYFATPGPAAFEQSPTAPVEARVMFQTRLWTSAEVPAEEVEPLNSGRVAMVRALKRAFKDRFVGGLVPTPLALASYPDEVTPHPSRYAQYLALKKRCLISVYTRGVEHSLAFKLGETIAAAQCLVSVPLRYELPSPFLADRNYLSFETTDEAVSACQRLLDDRDAAMAMRHANHAYYVREVEPARHVENAIARARLRTQLS